VASQIAWIPVARPVRHQENAKRPVNRNRKPGFKIPGFFYFVYYSIIIKNKLPRIRC